MNLWDARQYLETHITIQQLAIFYTLVLGFGTLAILRKK